MNSRILPAVATVCLSLAATPALAVTDAFVGELDTFTGSKCPAGWVPASGAVAPIALFPLLFQVVSTRYGGDGVTTFGIPKVAPRKTARNGALPPLPLTECIAFLGSLPSPD